MEIKNLEIILNLWYVYDKDGFIYSLRIRPYVHSGNDEDKLKYLKEHADKDYLIAKPFNLPGSIKSTFHRIESKKNFTHPIIHYDHFQSYFKNYQLFMFEEAIKEIEKELPSQTKCIGSPENGIFKI